MSPAGEINAYSVLRSRRVLVTKAALDALVASAKAKSAGGATNGDGAAKPARAKRVDDQELRAPVDRPRRKQPSNKPCHATYPKPRASTSSRIRSCFGRW